MTEQYVATFHQPAWLREAWRLLGIRELKGRAHNKTIVNLYRDAGHPSVSDDETPWCAAFVGACLERAGVNNTKSLMSRSYTTWGRAAGMTTIGAVAVLSRGSNPSLGHVGFIVGETSEKLFLLGGNQKNSVSVQAFPKSRFLAARWPNDASSAAPTKPEKTANFQHALAHVLEMEGGYGDDPHDPGGSTNYGITLKVFAGWVGEPLKASNRDDLKRRLKAIPRSMVEEIYAKNYWRRAHCHDLPKALTFMHFDCAVNQGVSRAMRFLQTAVGTEADGEMGPLTRAAIKRTPTIEALQTYAGLRRVHYRSLHHFWRFGKGWLRRVNTTLSRVLKLSAPEDATAPSLPEQSTDRQNVEKDSKMATKTNAPTAPKWWGNSMTIWGTLLTALTTVLPTLGPVMGLNLSVELVQQAGTQFVTVLQSLMGLLGTIIAIYGRTRATQPLGLRKISLRV